MGKLMDEEVIALLRSELKEDTAERRAVAMGCARHSMGGQSLYLNGTAITFDAASSQPDLLTETYVVQSGIRWRQVISELDPLGFSPAVMQSNNDFGVGGTLSANAHGWAFPKGPFGTTVRWFRLMLADGSIVRCSRNENAELFEPRFDQFVERKNY